MLEFSDIFQHHHLMDIKTTGHLQNTEQTRRMMLPQVKLDTNLKRGAEQGDWVSVQRDYTVIAGMYWRNLVRRREWMNTLIIPWGATQYTVQPIEEHITTNNKPTGPGRLREEPWCSATIIIKRSQKARGKPGLKKLYLHLRPALYRRRSRGAKEKHQKNNNTEAHGGCGLSLNSVPLFRCQRRWGGDYGVPRACMQSNTCMSVIVIWTYVHQ